MEYYENFEDKDAIFDREQIDDFSDFEKTFGDLNPLNSDRIIYRGLKSAKYKLHTSGQRVWYEMPPDPRMDYFQFMSKQIEAAEEIYKRLLPKFYSQFGFIYHRIAILSFLQHYGGATPFLDFTYNFNIALWFSMNGAQKYEHNNRIDNYFSVYKIELDDDIKSIDSLFKEYFSNPSIDYLNTKIPIEELQNRISNSEELINLILKTTKPFHMPSSLSNGFVTIPRNNAINLVYDKTNLNIINQEGVFIYNPSDNEPLERIFDQDNPNYKIKCWDINKNLIKTIRGLMKKDSKTSHLKKSFIYPKEKEIAKEALRVARLMNIIPL